MSTNTLIGCTQILRYPNSKSQFQSLDHGDELALKIATTSLSDNTDFGYVLHIKGTYLVRINIVKM